MTEPSPALEVFVREGYRLTGWYSIAIPIKRTRLLILVEERTELPDTIRYLMGFVDKGVSQPRELAGVMGLDEVLVEAILVEAYHADMVVARRDGSIALAPAGARSLHEASQLRRFETTVDLAVDMMVGTAVPWHHVSETVKVRPRDLRALDTESETGYFAVPHPRRPPALKDLDDRSGARNAIENALRSARESPKLLEVLGIEPPQQSLFRTDAFALHVTPIDGGPPEWDFVVGGRFSAEHALSFIDSEKRRKRKILPELEEIDLSRYSYGIVEDEVTTAVKSDWEQRVKEGKLTQEVAELATRSDTAPDEADLSRVDERLKEMEAELAAIRSQTGPTDLQILNVHEHRPFLLEHIGLALHRILIVSPWIKPAAFDTDVESTIRDALERGVHVAIRYGYANEGVSRAIQNRLERLASKFENFDHRDVGNIHTKTFAVDNLFATQGSFNWLSFRGDPERTYREEKSFVVWRPWAATQEFAAALDPEVFLRTRPPEDTATNGRASGVVIVEGWTDQQYMQLAAEAAGRKDLLDSLEIRHVRGGAQGAAAEAIAFEKNNPGHPMIALFDSDAPGRTAAKDVKRYTDGGSRVVVQYHEVAETGMQEVEAEDLFPISMMTRFIRESGGESLYDASVKAKDGGFRYSLSTDAKSVFVEWLGKNLDAESSQRWIALLELIHKKMRLDE